MVNQLTASALCVVISAALIPLLHVSIMRVRQRPQETLAWMAGCFLASFIVWNILFLWWEQEEVLQANAFLAGYALLGFLWFGYLEMMFKFYRGLSYTLLTDVERLQPATVDMIMRDFADGAGADEMLQRRLNKMQMTGLIRLNGNTVTLTSRGKNTARMTSALKSLLMLGKCG